MSLMAISWSLSKWSDVCEIESNVMLSSSRSSLIESSNSD